MANEVGLRLLLSKHTNTLASGACIAVGAVYPTYCTYKALESSSIIPDSNGFTKLEDFGKEPDNLAEQQHWLRYWAVLGCVMALDKCVENKMSQLPYYYHAKLAFLIWLHMRHSGAGKVYREGLKPFFDQHKQNIDMVIVGMSHGLKDIVQTYQSELEIAGKFAAKLLRRGLRSLRQAIKQFAEAKDVNDQDGFDSD
mmetsp:Transcript_6784/g.25061  ORF Transcript_6784/g.25061 Transcript_6784/m.25061 type:complete len:197 (-) Transcript_6784:694-1284(-)